MGLNYSYEIIFQPKNVNNLLYSMGNFLSKGSMERVRNAIPWKPEAIDIDAIHGDDRLFEIQMGIAGIERSEYESKKSYCLSISVPQTHEMLVLCEEYGFSENISSDYIEIGCVWASITVGKEWGILSLSAATSSMSRLFEQSKDIQQLIVKELHSHSELIAFDAEDEHWKVIHPKNVKVYVNDIDEYMLQCNIGEIDVDTFAQLIVDRLKKQTT